MLSCSIIIKGNDVPGEKNKTGGRDRIGIWLQKRLRVRTVFRSFREVSSWGFSLRDMSQQTITPTTRGTYKHQGDWITAICAHKDHIVSASRGLLPFRSLIHCCIILTYKFNFISCFMIYFCLYEFIQQIRPSAFGISDKKAKPNSSAPAPS